tara:strand:- start:5676 stop:7040 length:1365 start_codon:yes stop_codon:yes gene_type:complete
MSVLSLAGNGLSNGGFEQGLDLWILGDQMSAASSAAARDGEKGLRVVDQDEKHGSSLFSRSFPVEPGATVTLTFEGRADSKFLAVYLWPMNGDGRAVRDPSIRGDGLAKVVLSPSGEGWRSYTVEHTMPPATESVKVWVHSWSGATGTADLDNFVLSGLGESAEPYESPEDVQKASEKAVARFAEKTEALVVPAELPARENPPVIILKLDDLRPVNGEVHPSWKRVTEYLQSKEIPCGIGIICDRLEEASPDFVEWTRAQRASGEVEFWFHGLDHLVWTDETGARRSEFSGRTPAEQQERFERSQKLAEDVLGFPFQTFGPGGGGSTGHQDAATAQAMSHDSDLVVWLYPRPIDTMGKEIVEEGQIIVLDRVWEVNLEGRVGQPDYERFVSGYAANPDREYFVLQGHPTHWGGARFEEFSRIIDFLVEQDAVFLTPVAYATSLDGEPAQQVSRK